MSTFIEKPANVERKWFIIDAEGKSLGRVAAAAAHLLRGKHKVTFTPHVDSGDHVIIINAEKAVLTGKKLEQKFYRRHSGWMGGLKETRYDKLMKERPELAMTTAVKGMIPKNTLGRKALTRLRVHAGESHNHEAQNPVFWERKI